MTSREEIIKAQEKMREILRTKKRNGRGLRTGRGDFSRADTNHLHKILTYLTFVESDCMTGISREIGIKSFYIKDALLFLVKVGLVKKIRTNLSTSYYYQLNKDVFKYGRIGKD
jgi:hypothetical protein